MSLLTTKESYRKRAILRALLQLYVDHSTIEAGLSLADVSTTLSLSRAHTEAVVETLLSEGYLYSTIDDEHHQITCDEMPSDEELSSLAASQGPQRSAPSATAPSATAPSRQQLAPWLRRELTQMAPGPLDALPALFDIVANDERAAELSAAPSKEPMTLKIIRARVLIDFYPSARAMAVDVRNLLLSARDHYARRDTALAGHAMALLRRFENALAQEEGLPVDPAHEEPISALQAERLAEWRPAARNLDEIDDDPSDEAPAAAPGWGWVEMPAPAAPELTQADFPRAAVRKWFDGNDSEWISEWSEDEVDPNYLVACLQWKLEETTRKLRETTFKLEETTRERDDHERERQTAYEFIERQKDELARQRRDIAELERLPRCLRTPPYFTGPAGLAGGRIIADYSCDSASMYIFP